VGEKTSFGTPHFAQSGVERRGIRQPADSSAAVGRQCPSGGRALAAYNGRYVAAGADIALYVCVPGVAARPVAG
jgi:hypothetical protein